MFPKHADTSIGGVPRSALVSEKAMASLTSSNLSAGFGGVTKGNTVIGGELDFQQRTGGITDIGKVQVPRITAKETIVDRKGARAVLNKMKQTDKEITKYLKKPDANPMSKGAVAIRQIALKETISFVQTQMRLGSGVSDGGIRVPSVYADIARVRGFDPRLTED
jgi:hypothetical protein